MNSNVRSISFFRDFMLHEAFEGSKRHDNFVPMDHILRPLFTFMKNVNARAGFADKVTKRLFPPGEDSFTAAHKLFDAVPFAQFCSTEEKERLLAGCIQIASPNHYRKVLSLLKRPATEAEIRSMAGQREAFRMKKEIAALAAGFGRKAVKEVTELLEQGERRYMDL